MEVVSNSKNAAVKKTETPPSFTIFVKDNIVHGVISHNGQAMTYNVVDYDLLKAQGTTALQEFEKQGDVAFIQDPCEIVPIEDLIKHL